MVTGAQPAARTASGTAASERRIASASSRAACGCSSSATRAAGPVRRVAQVDVDGVPGHRVDRVVDVHARVGEPQPVAPGPCRCRRPRAARSGRCTSSAPKCSSRGTPRSSPSRRRPPPAGTTGGRPRRTRARHRRTDGTRTACRRPSAAVRARRPAPASGRRPRCRTARGPGPDIARGQVGEVGARRHALRRLADDERAVTDDGRVERQDAVRQPRVTTAGAVADRSPPCRCCWRGS